MSYRPQLQPPPPTGNDAFDLWMKRTVETIQEYLVKDRELGHGIQHDATDAPEVGYSFMFLHKV